MGAGLLEQNPMLYANKPKPLPARDRVLTEDELRTAWAALGDDDYGDIFRLLVYTASRRNEIGGLRWGEVNFADALIEFPAARMKNGKPHVIPLSEPALAILKRRSATTASMSSAAARPAFRAGVGGARTSTRGSSVSARIGCCTTSAASPRP